MQLDILSVGIESVGVIHLGLQGHLARNSIFTIYIILFNLIAWK